MFYQSGEEIKVKVEILKYSKYDYIKMKYMYIVKKIIFKK